MKPVTRQKTRELVAAVMRDELVAGRWPERLPGARVLAKRLGVSPPTVAAALELLVAEGLLEKPGKRQALKFVGGLSPRGRNAPSKKLLILTNEEPYSLGEIARRVLDSLRSRMLDKGWEVESQVVDYSHVKRPQLSWDRILQIDPETRVIAIYGQPALAEWAIERGVRMLFLGGQSGGYPVPLVGVSSARMAELALGRLTSLGHRKVMMPLCDRTEAFKEKMRAATRRAVEAAGQVYVTTYHNPESDYMTPEVTWRILDAAFADDPPSALVFLDWKELLSAYCLLSNLGLRVPADVSLVMLNDQTEVQWFRPELCRFRFPENRLVRKMMAWLDGRFDGETELWLEAEWIEGKSVAPPRSPA